MGHALGRGVGPVHSAECVRHVDVRHRGQFLGEVGVVFLLFLVETQVLQQHDLPGLQRRRLGLGVGADHIGRHNHILAQQLGQPVSHDLQREALFPLPLGPAQVGAGNDRSAVAQQVLDGGQGGHNALVIGDHAGLLVQGHVKIAAEQDFFAVYSNVFYGFLVVIHSFCLQIKILYFLVSISTLPISPSPKRPGKPCWRSAS